MKEFMTFIAAVAVLAVAQTLAQALVVVLMILALLGVVAFPRQTFGLIASLGLLVLATKEPVYCVAALGAVGVAVAVAGRAGRAGASAKPTVLQLPDRSRD